VFESELMNGIETPGQRKPGTVLIVDDDPADIRFTQRVISAVSPQFRTNGLKSGEALISYLKGEKEFSDRGEFPHPILILLDLKMPGMHGFDVLRWLAKNPPHNLIPVFVLTVSGEVPLARYAYELGARSFLTKPLTASEFSNTIIKFEDCLAQP
jgi:CheY-like chemotaxis protein